jgi:hypothetical protein
MVVEDARHVDLESDIVDRGVNSPSDFVVAGRHGRGLRLVHKGKVRIFRNAVAEDAAMNIS